MKAKTEEERKPSVLVRMSWDEAAELVQVLGKGSCYREAVYNLYYVLSDIVEDELQESEKN